MLAASPAVQARDAGEQRHRSGIDVDADGIDAIFDDGIEIARQLGLRDIVLVLADADRFGVDLDQFGQRVLQAAGDGHGTADRNVEVGEFLGGEFGGGIDRGAGFGNDNFGQPCFRVTSS